MFPEGKEKRKAYKLLKLNSFDPESKTITGIVESADGEQWTCARGAPKAILEMCHMSEEVAESYKSNATDIASRGLRSLGIARKREINGGNWELLGLTPMNDPPRDDTASAIQLSRSLGVDVKMFTGDAVSIAKVTAGSLNLDGGEILNLPVLIKQLFDDTSQPDADVINKAPKTYGYAETFPEQKKQITSFFQKHSHRVAVIGDGVNDKAALQTADCGVAVEGASEPTQSAADVVMLTPKLTRIVDAIQVCARASST